MFLNLRTPTNAHLVLMVVLVEPCKVELGVWHCDCELLNFFLASMDVKQNVHRIQQVVIVSHVDSH